MTASTSQTSKPSNLTHVPKRRKVSKSLAQSSSSMTMQVLGPATNRGSGTSSTCGSCYRYVGMTPNNATQCARCSSTSCMICSRTCTAYRDSQLSEATEPSSQAEHLLVPSCKRAVASSSIPDSSMLDSTINPRCNQSAKRKKASEDDAVQDYPQESEEDGLSREVRDSGCGRVVCRNCCVENVSEGTTSCHDCLSS